MRSVKLGTKLIGDGNPSYIIAEIGGNFLTFKEAQKLIDLAVGCGVDCVKLQTFRADTIASKKAVYDMPNVGKGVSQYDLFKKYEVDIGLHKEIWQYCKEKGVFVFSTPSHMTDVELLEKVGCEAYKIGSDDAYNLPFLEDVASIGKPIVLSTGMCTMQEVRESVSAILGKGNPDLVLLHCVTNYPCKPEHVNLRVMNEMKREFGVPVGYSDHTLGIAACVGAGAMGANVLEKHFTHDKKAEGPDHMLSAEPAELRTMVEMVREIEIAWGDGIKRPSAGEQKTRVNNRKSIVAQVDIPPGTVITKEMVEIMRPGFGIQPKHFKEVLGRSAKQQIRAGEPIQWGQI
jgi:N,N'-diacetyllegionaminate synthase